MSSFEWFRMYHEFATDPKVQRMSEANQRRLVMLFCIRCSNGYETLHETISDEDIAFQMRISDDEWASTKAVFIEKGFIDERNNVLNWSKRQFPSDSSTARVRAFRERKKNGHVTHETFQKRSCNGLEPEPETEPETEKSAERERARETVPEVAQPEHEPPRPPPPTRHGEVAIRLRDQGVRIQPADPYLCDWVSDGVTDAELDQAVAKARRCKNETEPIAAAYLNPIVREVIAGRSRKPQRAQRSQSESSSRFAEKYGHVIPDAAG